MARRKSPTLTEAELRLMNALWENGAMTVGEVAAAIPQDDTVAYTTVLTTLRVLETKGYVRRSKQGRGHVYEPAVDRGQAQRSTVDYVVSRFFGGSHGSLVLNALDECSDAEIAELERMIEERKKA